MKTIEYKFPKLTELEASVMRLESTCSPSRIAEILCRPESVIQSAFSRGCDKVREQGMWLARERDGRPHTFTVAN